MSQDAPRLIDENAHAANVVAANRRRRRVRFWISVCSIPVVLFGLLVVGKVLSMYAFAHQTISAYVVGDFARAEAAAGGQGFLNWFEPYKAPYNVGTSLAGAERLPESRLKLEEALTLASGLEVCSVRINLSLVIERMGDAARVDGDTAAASALFAEALAITIDTPEECHSEDAQQNSPDPERDMSKTLDENQQRQQEKQQDAPPSEEEKPEAEEPQPSEDKLDALQEQLQQGTQERDDQQGDGSENNSGTDRPW